MSREHPRILVAHWPSLHVFDADDLAALDELGELVHPEPVGDLTTPAARDLLARTEVIVGHWGCPSLDADVVAAAPDLGLFAYAAGTVKGQVTDAVWDRGIRVTSGSDANAEPVAEYTLAAILWANKGVLWRRGLEAGLGSLGHPRLGNYDRTIGIVSASLVGRRVIELLRPFPRLFVTLYDPFVSAAEATELGVTKVDLDELCAGADVVSVHAPELPATRHLIGVDQLEAMRDGATLINTARGSIVDHDALLPHVASGRLQAILDVTDPEPLPADSPLLSLPNVWISPHLAGSQGSELKRMTEYVVDEVRRWAAGEPARNEVTRDRLATMA